MGLTLTIENETSLPDGGPLSVRVSGTRGLDIGRDRHLDWTLPDPTRQVSGKHCEIRHRDGAYWLCDVSTNGTFLNGSDGRLQSPYRLRNGDRLTIGHYIVAVTVDGDEAIREQPPPRQPSTPYHELWAHTDDVAPPIERKLLKPVADQSPLRPDFLDWAADIPEPARSAVVPADTASRRAADDWARGTSPTAPSSDPPPAIPAPRRPVWISNEPSAPWGPAPAGGAQPAPGEAPARATPAAAAGLPASPPPPSAPGEFIQHFARGAGMRPDAFSQEPDRLAEQLGVIFRLVTEHMRQLLNARLQAKRLARMSNQTTIEALDNNPLKFAPNTEEALRIMFGPPNRSYLDAARALEQGFGDLKLHQMQTYSAMQRALAMMIADLEPQAIDRSTEPDRGLSAVVGSRKARLWDAYVARWQAKTRGQDNGLVDVFMRYFAECYDGPDGKVR
jgi:type VI secretion system protein ImpI